jgi:hypothetical protein
MQIKNTKIGDVFSVEMEGGGRKYFQLIAFDLTQLNSDVIRVFKKIYPINAAPELNEIVNGKIEFYAHCITKLGLKMSLWKKIGNSAEIGAVTNVLFRGTSDYGKWIEGEPIKISREWYVWNVNERFRDVGTLTGENRKAEIGIVVNPHDIVERMRLGKYSFFYPDFE